MVRPRSQTLSEREPHASGDPHLSSQHLWPGLQLLCSVIKVITEHTGSVYTCTEYTVMQVWTGPVTLQNGHWSALLSGVWWALCVWVCWGQRSQVRQELVKRGCHPFENNCICLSAGDGSSLCRRISACRVRVSREWVHNAFPDCTGSSGRTPAQRHTQRPSSCHPQQGQRPLTFVTRHSPSAFDVILHRTTARSMHFCYRSVRYS